LPFFFFVVREAQSSPQRSGGAIWEIDSPSLEVFVMKMKRMRSLAANDPEGDPPNEVEGSGARWIGYWTRGLSSSPFRTWI